MINLWTGTLEGLCKTPLHELPLRQHIEKLLSRIELSNKFSKAVFFDKNQEFDVPTSEEQTIVVACKSLIQNAIVLWNYLYLTFRTNFT